jgi:hypothetical protein
MFEIRVISVMGGGMSPRSPLPCDNLREAEDAARSLAEQGCTVEMRNLQTGEVRRFEPPSPGAKEG